MVWGFQLPLPNGTSLYAERRLNEFDAQGYPVPEVVTRDRDASSRPGLKRDALQLDAPAHNHSALRPLGALGTVETPLKYSGDCPADGARRL